VNICFDEEIPKVTVVIALKKTGRHGRAWKISWLQVQFFWRNYGDKLPAAIHHRQPTVLKIISHRKDQKTQSWVFSFTGRCRIT